jgi:hypothetical protein
VRPEYPTLRKEREGWGTRLLPEGGFQGRDGGVKKCELSALSALSSVRGSGPQDRTATTRPLPEGGFQGREGGVKKCELSAQSALSSVRGSGPQDRAATTPAGLGLLSDRANGHELLERGFDTFAAEMTMEEGPYLYSG